MLYDVLIRDAVVWSSEGGRRTDVAFADGLVAEVGDLGGRRARQEVDAAGSWLLPGAIDTQVHFREPGAEHKEDLETGSRAAVLGGVTAFFDMPNTAPATTSAEALRDKLDRAAARSHAHYAFYVGATAENASRLPELERLPGCCGVKVFMGSSTGDLLVEDDETLEAVLRNGSTRVAVHAEDEPRLRERRAIATERADPSAHPEWRDVESALRATRRLLALAELTGRPVHLLHVSTGDEARLVAEAKSRGLALTAEVTPQHLCLYAPDCYERLGTRAQMNPPIRDSWHQSCLRSALLDGVFDIVGSDHAPHTLEEKAQPYPKSPSGMPGVQTLLPCLLNLCWEGFLSPELVVRLVCEAPAEIFGVRGKGRLSPGFDADAVLVDPNEGRVVERSMLASKCGWSPFEGELLFGWPQMVWVKGRLVVAEERIVDGPFGEMLRFDR
ncbi:MAG: dihydroorotase [Fimbriimonadales bacterium]|nr:dihydroorotase [Fimbriimonadales bacterium]